MSIVPVPYFIYKLLEQEGRGEGRGVCVCACVCVKSRGADKCATPHKLLRGRGKE